jgi:hypothetical protein
MTYNPSEDTDYDFDFAPKVKESKYTKIGFLKIGGDKPTKFKILANVHHPEEKAAYHKLATHGNKINGKFFTFGCPRSVNQECPICDKYYKTVSRVKELEKTKANPEELDSLKKIQQALKPTQIYRILAVEAGKDEIVSYDMKTTLFKIVFGTGGADGLFNEFREMQVNPISPKSPFGWIDASRKGTALQTEYSASLSLTRDIKTRSMAFTEQFITEKVAKELADKDKLYRIRHEFTNQLWKSEDIKKYADSNGTDGAEWQMKLIYRDAIQSVAQQEGIAAAVPEVKPTRKQIIEDDSDIPF